MSVSQYFLALKAGCAMSELSFFPSSAVVVVSIQCENNLPVTNTS